MNFIIKIINAVINFFIDTINKLIQLLPESPFSNFDFGIDNKYLNFINWIFPLNEIVALVADIAIVFIGFIGIRFILRKLGFL